MVVNILNNWNLRYSSNYIIKFVRFIPIYYTINLNIILSFIVFSNLYIGSIDLLKVWINKIIILKKKLIFLINKHNTNFILTHPFDTFISNLIISLNYLTHICYILF